MYMKTKGQQSKVAKLEPLAICFSVSWQSGLTHQPYTLRNGVITAVHGFESRTHHQNETSPATALTAARESIRTAEAAQTRNLIMWLPAVELNRRFHSDLPQLQNRSGKER
jgi:GH24 family phage-related lysozyme (muramidase)